MRFITDFADSAVVLPLAVIVAFALLLLGWRRGALAWVVAIGGTLAAMLLLKLLGDWALGPLGLRSPSGHTAAAGALYGGVIGLLLVRSSAAHAAAVAFACVVLVAVTRLDLGAHSLPEVLAGGVVGVLGAAALRALAGLRPPDLNRRRLALIVLLAASGLHGQHLSLERSINHMVRGCWPRASCRADQRSDQGRHARNDAGGGASLTHT